MSEEEQILERLDLEDNLTEYFKKYHFLDFRHVFKDMGEEIVFEDYAKRYDHKSISDTIYLRFDRKKDKKFIAFIEEKIKVEMQGKWKIARESIDIVKFIADLMNVVSDFFGGKVKNNEQLKIFAALYNSNAVMKDGRYHFMDTSAGFCRHRCIAFKVACEFLNPPIPCRYIQGILYIGKDRQIIHTWNTIELRGEYYLVDTMNQHSMVPFHSATMYVPNPGCPDSIIRKARDIDSILQVKNLMNKMIYQGWQWDGARDVKCGSNNVEVIFSQDVKKWIRNYEYFGHGIAVPVYNAILKRDEERPLYIIQKKMNKPNFTKLKNPYLFLLKTLRIVHHMIKNNVSLPTDNFHETLRIMEDDVYVTDLDKFERYGLTDKESWILSFKWVVDMVYKIIPDQVKELYKYLE